MKHTHIFQISVFNSKPLTAYDIEMALRDRGFTNEEGELERWRPTVREIPGNVVRVEKIKELCAKTAHVV